MVDINAYSGCNAMLDREFGPAVRCKQFDFTLTFEQSIFCIGVSSIFILIFPFRIYSLYGASIKTSHSATHVFKIGASAILLTLQVALLALWIKDTITKMAVAAAAINFLSMSAVFVLTVFEHSRTIRPSTVICLYLLASVVADSVELRTLNIRGYNYPIVGIISAGIVGKVLLLFLESWPKRSYLKSAKDYGPEEVMGIFGRSVLWWLNSLFWTGSRKILSLSDLYPLDHELHSKVLRTRMLRSWQKNKNRGSYSLLYAILSCLRWELLRTALPRAAMIGFSYSQTFLITAAINFLDTPANRRNVDHAYGLIGAAALIYLGLALSIAQYNLKVFRMVTTFRGAMVSMIYSRSLSISSAFGDAAPVTLMSTDVERVASGLTSGVDIWAQVVEVGIGTWLLWRQLGASSVAPILLVIICFTGQTFASRNMSPKQAIWVKAVQSRVGVASTILGSIKSIKLSGLTSSMHNLLQAERKRELDLAKKFRWLMVLTNTIANIPSIVSGLIVFATFSIESKLRGTPSLSTAQAFSSLAILTLLNSPAATLLSNIPSAIASLGCVKRIQDFLESADFHDPRSELDSSSKQSGDRTDCNENSTDQQKSSRDQILSVSNLILKSVAKPEIKQPSINFTLKRATVTLILGPVGSGKTTLLKALLGEMSSKIESDGSIRVKSPLMAYCSQTPWLQNSTVRDNIVGPNGFEEDWYRTVIWLCDLDDDISQMPSMDLSEIGSRVLTLSGGQKHRIALARALYSRCSIFILDDFVASLDQNTRTLIGQRLFSKHGHIRRHGHTVLLATHDESYAAFADNILVLDHQGLPEYFGPPNDWGKFAFETEDLEKDDISELPASEVSTGKNSNIKVNLSKPDKKTSKADEKTDSKRQMGDITTWLYYGKTVGVLPLVLLGICVVLAALGVNFPKLLLKWSTEDKFSVGKFIGIYALTVLITWACQAAMLAQMMIIIATRSAMTLHKVLVTATLQAPLSFFEATDSSILLNRFSQDMSLVDMAVPVAIFIFILTLSTCLVDLAFVCIGSKYMAATVPVTIFAVYIIQKFYLRTSRQMRLLDLESKSPLYKQFTETIEGIITIRAFGWQQHFESNMLQSLDDSQKPFYLLYCIQRWLNLVLDLTTATIGIAVIAFAVCLPQSSNAGSLGVALTSLLSFNSSLQGLISSYTGAETVIGSVTRTRMFEKETPREDSDGDLCDPGPEWPRGDIHVSELTALYGNGKSGIRNVSFDVKAGQKLGVIGRTGSGKSTLLLSLLRLVDPVEGMMSIDGVDITQIPRNTTRERLTCLPQDPLVFPKSFLFNLDPNGLVSDTKTIESVLELVGLSSLVNSRGGLSALVEPATLSLGEQQLLVLARAILIRRISNGRCILILDEATSSIDSATEAKIQEVVQKEFKENTVITVAHRLDLIRECNTVIVFDSGKVIKSGSPEEVFSR